MTISELNARRFDDADAFIDGAPGKGRSKQRPYKQYTRPYGAGAKCALRCLRLFPRDAKAMLVLARASKRKQAQ